MGSQEDGITRRELGALAATALAAAPQLGAQNPAEPVLDIAEWSYFWVGVEKISTARGTLCNGMQMYVEYWIPAQVRHPYPVVLVHGGYGQGTDWISTPDGKRGWASLLVEQGYKVYVVDRPGQGRPPYFPWFHGYFDERAQTFEAAAKELGRDVNDPVWRRRWLRRGSRWRTMPSRKIFGGRGGRCCWIRLVRRFLLRVGMVRCWLL